MIPDPTFSLTLNGSHAENYLKRRNIAPNVPIIGLDLPVTVSGVREAVQHFRTKGYLIATWRGSGKMADYDFSGMNPLEWAGMFSRYRLTLTNRFHASIFSLKNMTPVIAVDHKQHRVTTSLRSKNLLLLDSFGMKDTHYRNSTDLRDDKWFIHSMESSLRDPPIERIKAGLQSRKIEFAVYMNRIRNLFNLPPVY